MHISRERHYLMLDGVLLFFWYTAIVAVLAILMRLEVMVSQDAISSIQDGVVPKDYYAVFPLIFVTGFGLWHARRFLHERNSSPLTFRMTPLNMLILGAVSVVVFSQNFLNYDFSELLFQVRQPTWGMYSIPESLRFRPIASAYLYYSFDNSHFAGPVQHLMLMLYAIRRLCCPFVIVALSFYVFTFLERFKVLREFPDNLHFKLSSFKQRFSTTHLEDDSLDYQEHVKHYYLPDDTEDL